MKITKRAYEEKVGWLKPIKCELIAAILFPGLFKDNRKKAVALVRMAKRWGGIRYFTSTEIKTLEKYKAELQSSKSIAKLKKAIIS